MAKLFFSFCCVTWFFFRLLFILVSPWCSRDHELTYARVDLASSNSLNEILQREYFNSIHLPIASISLGQDELPLQEFSFVILIVKMPLHFPEAYTRTRRNLRWYWRSLRRLRSKWFSKSNILAQFSIIPLEHIMKFPVPTLDFLHLASCEVVFGEFINIFTPPVKIEAVSSLYEGASIHVISYL